jgi:hypothetical protein
VDVAVGDGSGFGGETGVVEVFDVVVVAAEEVEAIDGEFP